MKAHIENSKESNLLFHGHPIRLSVSLVVKNEEKHLRRCIESILPLLKAVPSELIITDTGSTDKTVEIAKEYTDKVYFFEWCGNISAARNFGMSHVQGEWFMSMDADEWFENTDAIIEFFNSGECNKYDQACYQIRNYQKSDGKIYSTQRATRLSRWIPSLHYEGRIHDALECDKLILDEDKKYLSSYVHHYGYAYANEQEHLAKSMRNIPLLLEDLQEFPDNMRYRFQLAQEYLSTKEYDKVIEECQKGLETEKRSPNHIRRAQFLLFYSQALFIQKKYEELTELVAKYVNTPHLTCINRAELLRPQQNCFLKLKKYEESIKAGLGYLQTYKEFENSASKDALLARSNGNLFADKFRSACYRDFAIAYTYLGQYSKAATYLDKIDFSCDLDVITPSIIAVFLLARMGNMPNVITKCYERIQATGNIETYNKFISIAEKQMFISKNFCILILQALMDTASIDPYIMLCKLRLAAQNEDENESIYYLKWFLQNKDTVHWSSLYFDILTSSMKYRVDVTSFLEVFDMEDLQCYISNILSLENSPVQKIFISYALEQEIGKTPKEMYLINCVEEKIIISGEGLSDNSYLSFFSKFIKDMDSYAHLLYCDDVYSQDRINLLPRIYRFTYYMKLAYQKKENNNFSDYLQNLKKALKCYPVLKKPVELLIEQFEKEQETINKAADEFVVLAQQAKASIEEMITQGKLQEAGQAATELNSLLPNDPDVARYRKLTGCEPNLHEIVANLPQ